MKENAHYIVPWVMNLLRYFIIAGIPFLIFYIYFPNLFSKNRIQKRKAKRKDFLHEIKNSVLTTAIFGLIFLLFYKTSLKSYTQIYNSLSDYPIWWMPVSIFLALILHDTYFYWMHRTVHHPKIYGRVHAVHHKSINPSPWASYSFHFYEAVLEALIAPIIFLLIPMHPLSLFILAFVSFGINVYGHLGFEIAPKWLRNSPFFEVVTTSIYHNLHHSRFHGNYGLYFRVWDRLMGTENPDYVKEYDKIQVKRFGKNQKDSKLKKPIVTGLFLFFLGIGTTTAQEDIVGNWRDDIKGVTIEVFKDNGKFYGKLVDSDDEEDNKKIKSKEDIIILKDFEKAKGVSYCCGTIYQPKLKREFTGTLVLLNKNQLELNVKFQGMSRTRIWRRL